MRIRTRPGKARHPECHQRRAVKNRRTQRRERIGQQLRNRDFSIRIIIIDQRQGDRCGRRATAHPADRRRAAQIDGCEAEGGRRAEIARHPEADRCLTIRPLDDVESIRRHRHISIRNAELHARLGIAGQRQAATGLEADARAAKRLVDAELYGFTDQTLIDCKREFQVRRAHVHNHIRRTTQLIVERRLQSLNRGKRPHIVELGQELIANVDRAAQ